MLNLTKNHLMEETLSKIYYAHIYSHLSYSLVVWGSMLSATLKEDLFRVQKACIRLIHKKKKNAPMDELFRKSEILKFPDLIKLELIKFGYRIRNGLLPNPIQYIMNSKGKRKEHRYPTHNKNISNIQAHMSVQFNNSLVCKGLSVLCSTGKKIKGAYNLKACIKKFKK